MNTLLIRSIFVHNYSNIIYIYSIFFKKLFIDFIVIIFLSL